MIDYIYQIHMLDLRMDSPDIKERLETISTILRQRTGKTTELTVEVADQKYVPKGLEEYVVVIVKGQGKGRAPGILTFHLADA